MGETLRLLLAGGGWASPFGSSSDMVQMDQSGAAYWVATPFYRGSDGRDGAGAHDAPKAQMTDLPEEKFYPGPWHSNGQRQVYCPQEDIMGGEWHLLQCSAPYPAGCWDTLPYNVAVVLHAPDLVALAKAQQDFVERLARDFPEFFADDKPLKALRDQFKETMTKALTPVPPKIP